jgi:hypothetical protein
LSDVFDLPVALLAGHGCSPTQHFSVRKDINVFMEEQMLVIGALLAFPGHDFA